MGAVFWSRQQPGGAYAWGTPPSSGPAQVVRIANNFLPTTAFANLATITGPVGALVRFSMYGILFNSCTLNVQLTPNGRPAFPVPCFVSNGSQVVLNDFAATGGDFFIPCLSYVLRSGTTTVGLAAWTDVASAVMFGATIEQV